MNNIAEQTLLILIIIFEKVSYSELANDISRATDILHWPGIIHTYVITNSFVLQTVIKFQLVNQHKYGNLTIYKYVVSNKINRV